MELEEFKQKFNLPRINDYVALLSESQKNWFWEQLMEIKQVFPNIDIYHAGASKYGYLGFGRKRVQAKRVEDFLFVLHLEKNGNFILYIADQTYRLLRVDEDVLPQGYDQSVQKELNLKDWLDQVKTFTEELDLDYSGEDLYPVNYEVEDYFTTLEAYNFLKTKYQKIKEATKKIVGFRNNSNRELALILENSRPSLFIGVDPEDNQYFKFNFIDNNSKIFGKYDENEGRHDGLKSHAPSLYKGNKAYYIEINSLSDLEKFCEWYELAIQNSLTNSHPKEDKEMPDQIIVQPLNRILFGAAGTGKTFNTINHALSIIEDKSLEDLEKEEREDLKNRFDEYKSKGQIKFVTFHQSFSYEDFVEGIRAETNDQGNLRYEVKSGIFKEICELTKTTEFRSILGKEFGRGYILQAVSSDVLTVKKPNGNLIHLSVDLANLLLESVAEEKISIEDLSEKTALDKLDNNHGLLEPYIVNGYNSVWANLIKLVLEFRNQNNQPTKPHVLIIDEINRGNISRIFGELITLIEATKRAGADEALSVTLPYSKEEFAVPDNVYIIGTMNSSDRSLTGLDIALRRRFTFIEMPPQPNLLKDMSVEGVHIERLLTVINQRIEILIDRDHCIGHANFMVLKEQPTLENLAHIFKQKIIPQLQEYFFDDWAKINLVLNGNGMLKPKPVEKSVIFPNVDSEDLGYFEDKKTWELVPTSFTSIESFAKIIQH
ncbi:McrB family protein [Acinetobacter beijerinckii]|uniref:McrB family protein n=1 Tax=Acinetobacter beijerinckii TaxID=262668 RepID=UPI0040552700